jgi:PKD repeat protein
MKKSFVLALFSVFGQLVFAQSSKIDLQNTREGEKVEYCFQHKKRAELMKDSMYLKTLVQDEIIRQKEKLHGAVPKNIVYKIPIVFHVLHNNGVENISDEQILDGLAILNRDYRKLNLDAANVQADFDGVDNVSGQPSTYEARPSDVEIEFVLATKAPNGTCFNGITRTVNALTSDGTDGSAQVYAIINGNDVYNGQWPGNKYLNVFICADIGGAAGYTMNPSNWGGTNMNTGIFVLHDYVGSIGTSSESTSRTLTHEAGHWLNLDHTWGPNNNPGNTSSCSTDDGVNDTPDCIGVTSCSLNSNTCSNDNTYWGFNIKDNVENYMDYSYCSKMFTQGQVDRMRAAIVSSIGGRNNLWTASNLASTGANGNVYLCKADFSADKVVVCLGDSVSFNDDSYNAATIWSWSFPNGIPSTSTEQNPIVRYTQPGIYTVTLNASDGSSSDSETKTAYIRVLPNSGSLPFFDGFETYSSLTSTPNWIVVNQENNNAFALNSSTSHTGTKCVKLTNFGQTGPNVDELISAPVDLSNTASNGDTVTLSFRYAYRKELSTDNEILKIFFSKDCGETWVQRKTISGSQLSNVAVTSSWTPASTSEWKTVHITGSSISSDYWVDNFRYKFRFEGNNGNNLYIDDINIYYGKPSDSLITAGIDEQGVLSELNLFPNPVNEKLNLTFKSFSQDETSVKIVDICGKTIQELSLLSNVGMNKIEIDTHSISSGTYFISTTIQGSSKTMKFIKK